MKFRESSISRPLNCGAGEGPSLVVTFFARSLHKVERIRYTTL